MSDNFLREMLLGKILIIPAILLAFTFHEYAHAVVAVLLGDKTPKFQGRLTLNPFVHIDIIGFIMILLVGFGWAKPIETNPNAYKHYYKDDLKVSLAGPLGNLFCAFLFALICGLFVKIIENSGVANNVIVIIYQILVQVVSINCMLFLFNLIPLPGLDGFHILRDLYPKFFYNISDSLYRYQLIILIIFIFPIGNFSIAQYVVGYPSYAIANLFMKIGAML